VAGSFLLLGISIREGLDSTRLIDRPDNQLNAFRNRRPGGSAAIRILSVGHVRDESMLPGRASHHMRWPPFRVDHAIQVPTRQEKGDVTNTQRKGRRRQRNFWW
jgi:hypothetical protein